MKSPWLTGMCICSFDGLEHMGPLQDPSRVAARAADVLEASLGAASWAALPRSATLALHRADTLAQLSAEPLNVPGKTSWEVQG